MLYGLLYSRFDLAAKQCKIERLCKKALGTTLQCLAFGLGIAESLCAPRRLARLRDDGCVPDEFWRTSHSRSSTRQISTELAFARKDYAACVEWMTRVRHIAHRCGGSLAQCDLIHLTFTEAALRARKARLAHALVAERTAKKPGSRLNRWLQQRLQMMAPTFARSAAAMLPAPGKLRMLRRGARSRVARLVT